MTVEGFNSEKAVFAASKCLIALDVPFVRLTFALPIGCFSTSRRFGKGAEAIRFDGLMPRLREGREMGGTISLTDLTDMAFRADVGS